MANYRRGRAGGARCAPGLAGSSCPGWRAATAPALPRCRAGVKKTANVFLETVRISAPRLSPCPSRASGFPGGENFSGEVQACLLHAPHLLPLPARWHPGCPSKPGSAPPPLLDTYSLGLNRHQQDGSLCPVCPRAFVQTSLSEPWALRPVVMGGPTQIRL